MSRANEFEIEDSLKVAVKLVVEFRGMTLKIVIVVVILLKGEIERERDGGRGPSYVTTRKCYREPSHVGNGSRRR